MKNRSSIKRDNKMLAFINARVITPLSVIDPGAVLVNKGFIVGVGRMGELAIPTSTEVIDIQHGLITPGL